MTQGKRAKKPLEKKQRNGDTPEKWIQGRSGLETVRLPRSKWASLRQMTWWQ